jgi:integrase
MQDNAMPCDGGTTANGDKTVVSKQTHAAVPYQKAVDGRKRPIRGLWIRGSRYYARIAVEDFNTGRKQVRRVPLDGADSVAQAVAQMRRLLTRREDNALPVLKRTPKFSEYAKQYLDYYEKVKDAKRPKTLQTEAGHLNAWKAHLGETRIDRINRAMINEFIAKRQAAGISPRTVNLGVTVLRNVLRRGIDDGWLKTLPTENLRPLKYTPRKRELISGEQIKKICNAAVKVSKNGKQFQDYLLLLAYSGARMAEATRLKWGDVDWQQKQLTIGADGLTKNRKARVIDFNLKLGTHLKEMRSRRAPDTDWIFPSPQRGKQDIPAKTFRETLLLARQKANLRNGRDRLHDYCEMGRTSGRGNFDRQSVWAFVKRTRATSGSASGLWRSDRSDTLTRFSKTSHLSREGGTLASADAGAITLMFNRCFGSDASSSIQHFFWDEIL